MAPQQAALRLLLRAGSFDKSGTFFGTERAASVVVAKDGGVAAPGCGRGLSITISTILLSLINDDHWPSMIKNRWDLTCDTWRPHPRHGGRGLISIRHHPYRWISADGSRL
jgi:hypothetical protein